jgi:hypothetical protein
MSSNYPPSSYPGSESVSSSANDTTSMTSSGTRAPTMDRVVQGAHQTIDRLADKAAPHVERVSTSLHHNIDQARQVSDEWTESMRATVREVGMLISRLSR